eukprot:3852153-Pyramimonas_sp.AAC.1
MVARQAITSDGHRCKDGATLHNGREGRGRGAGIGRSRAQKDGPSGESVRSSSSGYAHNGGKGGSWVGGQRSRGETLLAELSLHPWSRQRH